jgi:hypothetical protein
VSILNLIHNERTKLSATALNGVAIASIVAGFITPLAALTFGVSGPVGRGVLVTALASFAWLAVGLGLHFLARALGRPQRMNSYLLLFAGPVLALAAGLAIYFLATRPEPRR